jgi:hypothetical protein
MRRFTRFALAGFTAASLACGLTVATSAAADASPASAAAGAAANAGQAAAAARAALAQLRIGRPVPGRQVPGSKTRAGHGLTKIEYFNWSGYGDTNTGGLVYSKVAGSWTQPAVTCTQEDEWVVTWVGIDGLTNSTVEQDGTLAQCFEGKAHYYTWWEMYPTNDIQVVGSTVKPGDKITGSVVRTGTSYALKVTDATTTANSFSTTQTCTVSGGCANSSAEWIAEAPTGPTGQYPLADFHSWKLTSATVTAGTKSGDISTFPDDEITMMDSSFTYPLASPGALTTGNSFTVTWDNSF